MVAAPEPQPCAHPGLVPHPARQGQEGYFRCPVCEGTWAIPQTQRGTPRRGQPWLTIHQLQLLKFLLVCEWDHKVLRRGTTGPGLNRGNWSPLDGKYALEDDNNLEVLDRLGLAKAWGTGLHPIPRITRAGMVWLAVWTIGARGPDGIGYWPRWDGSDEDGRAAPGYLHAATR